MISLVNITSDNIEHFLDRILEVERVSFPTPWTARSFRAEVNRSISHLWILTVGGEFAGYICFWLFAGEIHLMNLAIHPEKRGKGYAGYLLSKMAEKGAAEGVRKVWLEVRPSNLRARALYRRMGFREVGRRPAYYGDTGEDAIIMAMSLFQGREARGGGVAPALEGAA